MSQNQEQPLRLHPLLENISDQLAVLTPQELEGAKKILDIMWAYLHNTWFIQHDAFDRRALVKTVEELFEISVELSQNSGDLVNQNPNHNG